MLRHGRCRICCCELGSSKVYRIFSSLDVLTSVVQLLLEITQTPLDSEKDSNPKLCRSCYQEVNALWKRNFAVNRSKEDLKARMSRAEVFFARVCCVSDGLAQLRFSSQPNCFEALALHVLYLRLHERNQWRHNDYSGAPQRLASL